MRISDWSSDVCSSDLFMPRITRARKQPAPSTRPSAAPDAHRERAPRGSTSPKPRATAPLARGRPARDPEDRCRGPKADVVAPSDSKPAPKRRPGWARPKIKPGPRSEEHTSELQSLMRISYAVFCLKKKTIHKTDHSTSIQAP